MLLDTHLLIWSQVAPGRLGPALRALIEDPANDALFSAASAWEMAIKAGLGRADFGANPGLIVDAARAGGLVELPVTAAAALGVAALPHHHRDPFDRPLVAQAMAEPARLYTADPAPAPYSELVVVVRAAG